MVRMLHIGNQMKIFIVMKFTKRKIRSDQAEYAMNKRLNKRGLKPHIIRDLDKITFNNEQRRIFQEERQHRI